MKESINRFFTKILGANWLTSLGGLIGGLPVLYTQLVVSFFDNDPTTNPDMQVVWMTLSAMFVAFKARDFNVSSEDSGVVPKNIPTEYPNR